MNETGNRCYEGGRILDKFRLITDAESEDNFKKSISFKEKQNMQKISDLFQQRNYELTIKENFAVSIVRNLSLKLYK